MRGARRASPRLPAARGTGEPGDPRGVKGHAVRWSTLRPCGVAPDADLGRAAGRGEDGPLQHDLDTLAKMAASSSPSERLESLRIMREHIESGGRPEDYLAVARPLVADADNDCRWQALIVVGECIQSSPEAVWDVICQHGVSDDEDMRAGVATVLLEHLLEYHFDAYFPRLKVRIEGGSELLADTLSRCSPFGQAVPRWSEVRALTGRAG